MGGFDLPNSGELDTFRTYADVWRGREEGERSRAEEELVRRSVVGHTAVPSHGC
jgi:hypothetical protein